MMRLTLTCAVTALCALAACDTDVQSGDTTPPTLTILDLANDDAVVFTSDPDNAPTPVVCDNGALPFGVPANDFNNNDYYILPAGVDTTTLLVNFFDRSGIQSAGLFIPRDNLEVNSPDLPITTDPETGQQDAKWLFEETGTLRTSAGLTLNITVNDDRSPLPFTNFGFRATDGAGNEIPVRPLPIVFISTQERACQL